MTMTRKLKWSSSALLSLFALGCNNEVADTEGTLYSFECKSGTCHLSEKTDSAEEKSDSADAPKRAFLTQNEGRILTVCPAEKAGFECRPLTCDPNAPCSRLGGPDFVCEKNLCQAPDRALTPADKLALCLAKTGPFERTTKQLERITLARACTGDCKLPAACLKP